MDVTPREVQARGGRNWIAIGVLVVVVLAFGAIVFRALGDATLFFRTVSEATENREELGDDRFRLQGEVVPGTVETDATDGVVEVRFELRDSDAPDVTLSVVHQGDPPELFGDEIPVVLEGSLSDGVFASDRMLVKHGSEYVEENPDRVDDYPEDRVDDGSTVAE